MTMKDGMQDHDMGCAVRCAQMSRTAKPGAFDGGKPPSGPKSIGWKLNGVPAPKTVGGGKNQ